MILKDLPEGTQPTTAQPTTQPTATVHQEPQGQPTETTPNTAPNTPPAQNWQDAIKQNSMLFIIVGLLALGLGFIIGKNKA